VFRVNAAVAARERVENAGLGIGGGSTLRSGVRGRCKDRFPSGWLWPEVRAGEGALDGIALLWLMHAKDGGRGRATTGKFWTGLARRSYRCWRACRWARLHQTELA
jgi:hypothetical protein